VFTIFPPALSAAVLIQSDDNRNEAATTSPHLQCQLPRTTVRLIAFRLQAQTPLLRNQKHPRPVPKRKFSSPRSNDEQGLHATRSSSYYTLKWNEALAICRKNLNDEDEAQLDQIKTCDALLDSLAQFEESIPTPRITPLGQLLCDSLQPLRSFVTLLAAALGSTTIKTAIIWGIMSLVIQVGHPPNTWMVCNVN
jgi:hypothetical protein